MLPSVRILGVCAQNMPLYILLHYVHLSQRLKVMNIIGSPLLAAL